MFNNFIMCWYSNKNIIPNTSVWQDCGCGPLELLISENGALTVAKQEICISKCAVPWWIKFVNKQCFTSNFWCPFHTKMSLYTTQMSPSQLVRAGDDIYTEENAFAHWIYRLNSHASWWYVFFGGGGVCCVKAVWFEKGCTPVNNTALV